MYLHCLWVENNEEENINVVESFFIIIIKIVLEISLFIINSCFESVKSLRICCIIYRQYFTRLDIV